MYLIARSLNLAWRGFLGLYLTAVVGLSLDVLIRGGSSVPVFAPLVALTCTVELSNLIPVARLRLWRPRDVVADRRYALLAAGSFALALAVWTLSDTGRPWCDPDSLLQGHAFWHLCSAVSAGALYAYFASEEMPPADA